MPPKTRFTADMIIEASYEILVERGVDALVTRGIAKRMNATTQPIFSCFESMDDLKKQLYIKSKGVFMDYVRESILYDPSFKQFGLLWIQFAKTLPNVYCFLFCTGTKYSQSKTFIDEYREFADIMLNEICTYFGIQKKNAETLLNEMIIFAHGISTYLLQEPDSFSDDEICLIISDMCIGAVNNIHLRNNTFNQELAKNMALYAAVKPVKVK